MLKKIEKLPSSKGKELKAKDWIKAFGLVLILFLSTSAIEIKQLLTAQDFGQYNFLIQVTVFFVIFLAQRWAKDNSR